MVVSGREGVGNTFLVFCFGEEMFSVVFVLGAFHVAVMLASPVTFFTVSVCLADWQSWLVRYSGRPLATSVFVGRPPAGLLRNVFSLFGNWLPPTSDIDVKFGIVRQMFLGTLYTGHAAGEHCGLLVFNFMHPKIISNDFGGFGNHLADSTSIFVVAILILNDSNFWCVQSSTTCNETVHVHVLWPVCTHTIPFRMLWCP